MSNIKDQLVKLGSVRPELRPHIRPVLAELGKEASMSVEKAVRSLREEVGPNASEGEVLDVANFFVPRDIKGAGVFLASGWYDKFSQHREYWNNALEAAMNARGLEDMLQKICVQYLMFHYFLP